MGCKYWNKNVYKPCWNDGFIFDGLRYFFSILQMGSLIYWITEHQKEKGIPSPIRYRSVDIYILAWLSIEIVLFTSLAIFYNLSGNLAFRILLFFLVGYRLYDIFQFWVGQFVLGGALERWAPRSVYRSLVLVFIGYLEIFISFSIIAYVLKGSFNGISSWGDALYYSIRNAVTIGSSEIRPSGFLGYAVFITQMMFVLLFLTAVVNTIIGHKEEK